MFCNFFINFLSVFCSLQKKRAKKSEKVGKCAQDEEEQLTLIISQNTENVSIFAISPVKTAEISKTKTFPNSDPHSDVSKQTITAKSSDLEDTEQEIEFVPFLLPQNTQQSRFRMFFIVCMLVRACDGV